MVDLFVKLEEQPQMRPCSIQEIIVEGDIWGRCGHSSGSILPVILPDVILEHPLRVLQEDRHTRIDRVIGYIWLIQEVAVTIKLAPSQPILHKVTQRRITIKHTTHLIEQEELLIRPNREGLFKNIEISLGEN